MYRIKEITLHNFKFFYGNRVIDFDRKHILLYGENGSGKSSIYWALYTFFQSVFKSDVRQVQKYFLPITRNEESLKNRYAGDAEDSYIEILFENEPSDPRLKRISNTTVNTRTDNFIKEITLTSDLIDYKSIFNIYNFTNKSKVKLFGYFEKHLLPFVNLRTPLTKHDGTVISTNLEVWWDHLKIGLDPYPGIYDLEYIHFQNLISIFNTDFDFYLMKITETANNYLKYRFKEDFQIEFVYQNCTYNDFNTYNKGRNKKTLPPEIFLDAWLIDSNLDETSRKITRVHTFLNEARLSSIALAIRMAILKEKFIKELPKILILDDLLLSLDMGNREIVLSIILEEYLNDYQLIILTHDRVFFQSALSYIKVTHAAALKRKGEQNKATLDDAYLDHWKIFELYEATLIDGKRIPSITTHKSYLQKALYYFNDVENIDYNACGNNLRSALEEVLKEIIPSKFLRQEDGQPIAVTSQTLGTLIVKCTDFFNHLGFNVILLEKLDRYRERALNQTSHYNPKSNYFKKELQDTFEIINELKKYRFDTVIEKNSLIQLSIYSNSGEEYIYTFKTLDDICLYLEPTINAESFYCVNDRRIYAVIGMSHNGKSDIFNPQPICRNKTLNELYEETITALEARVGEQCLKEADMSIVFKNISGRSLEELKSY
ncbi:AAA family ATPase [Myroides odoratus]|uniref:AAA family ATPase n=1 Tax=Myroides odoratus TaxID=256 RepID=UPI0039AEFAF4